MSSHSKFPEIDRETPAVEAARRVFTLHLDRLDRHQPDVVTSEGRDVDAVHDMRVATRRLRAALRVFNRVVTGEKRKAFRSGLRETARSLGRLRDLHVFEETMSGLAGAPLDELRQAMSEAQEAEGRRLLDFLQGDRPAKLRRASARYLSSLRAPPGSPTAGQLAGRLVARRMNALGQFAPLHALSADELHALRIATKRLRYTVEFFATVIGPPAHDLLPDLIAVQDTLGAIQDRIVAVGFVQELAEHRTLGGTPVGVELPAHTAAAVIDMLHAETQHHKKGLPTLVEAIDLAPLRLGAR